MSPEGSPLFVERWRASRSQGLFLILYLYTFEIQWLQEAPLPHSARAIVFWSEDTACFAYSPTEYAIFSIPTMSAVEIVTPLPLSGPGTAMNALTGLTGYMTLGRGAKAKPTVVQVADSEVLLGKDGEHVFLYLSAIVSTTPGEGLFIGTDGKLSRPATIEWPVPPEEIGEFSPFRAWVTPTIYLFTSSFRQAIHPCYLSRRYGTDAASGDTSSHCRTSAAYIQSYNGRTNPILSVTSNFSNNPFPIQSS